MDAYRRGLSWELAKCDGQRPCGGSAAAQPHVLMAHPLSQSGVAAAEHGGGSAHGEGRVMAAAEHGGGSAPR
jgi:hypothetical protein